MEINSDFDFSNQEVIMADNSGAQAVIHDSFDAEAFQNALESYATMRETAERLAAPGKLATGQALFKDVFYSFLKAKVELNEADQMLASHRINRAMIEQMIGTSEYTAARANVNGDELASAIAAIGAADGMIKSLDPKTAKKINDLAETEKKLEELLNQKATLEDMIDVAEAEGQSELAGKMEAQAGAAGKEIKKLENAADKLAQDLALQQERLEDNARRAVRPALAAAMEEVKELNDAIAAFSGQGQGQAGGGFDPNGSSAGATMIGTDEKIAIARKLKANPRLKKLAELAGRFKRIAAAKQKEKIKQEPAEIVGIKTGRNLEHVVVSEYVNLADPATEDLFYLNYAEGRLLNYELQRHEKLGRGPIIVALDNSGSMGGAVADGFTREQWSKAVALALMSVARTQKRDIAITHFASPGSIRTFIFKKGIASAIDSLECAATFMGGGTYYKGWMDEAMQLVKLSAFNKADVIIVSDGEVSLESETVKEWNKLRQDREMSCYSVLIGAYSGREELARISDKVTDFENMTDRAADTALSDMFSI